MGDTQGEEPHEWLKQTAPPRWESAPLPAPADQVEVPGADDRAVEAPTTEATRPPWLIPTIVASLVVFAVVVVSAVLVERASRDRPPEVIAVRPVVPLPPTATPTTPPQATPTAPTTPQTSPASGTPIEPGVYIAAGPADIEGADENMAIEFEVEGGGSDAEITYVAGANLRVSECLKNTGPPSTSGVTVIDTDVKGHGRTRDGSRVKASFERMRIRAASKEPGTVSGGLRFQFEMSPCIGNLRFEAHRQTPGQDRLVDQIRAQTGP